MSGPYRLQSSTTIVLDAIGLEGSVTRYRTLIGHDGNPRPARHVTTNVKTDQAGARIVKSSSGQEIDLAVSPASPTTLHIRDGRSRGILEFILP